MPLQHFEQLVRTERDASQRARREQRDLPRNHNQPWSPADEGLLLDSFRAGSSIDRLATVFGRTTGAINARLAQLLGIRFPYTPNQYRRDGHPIRRRDERRSMPRNSNPLRGGGVGRPSLDERLAQQQVARTAVPPPGAIDWSPDPPPWVVPPGYGSLNPAAGWPVPPNLRASVSPPPPTARYQFLDEFTHDTFDVRDLVIDQAMLERVEATRARMLGSLSGEYEVASQPPAPAPAEAPVDRPSLFSQVVERVARARPIRARHDQAYDRFGRPSRVEKSEPIPETPSHLEAKMLVTEGHLTALSAAIKAVRPAMEGRVAAGQQSVLNQLAYKLAGEFEGDNNPAFDRAKWLEACGVQIAQRT